MEEVKLTPAERMAKARAAKQSSGVDEKPEEVVEMKSTFTPAPKETSETKYAKHTIVVEPSGRTIVTRRGLWMAEFKGDNAMVEAKKFIDGPVEEGEEEEE